MLMLQPLKAKYNRGISSITGTMTLVFKYWPCKKKKIKLGKDPTVVGDCKNEALQDFPIKQQVFKVTSCRVSRQFSPLYSYWPLVWFLPAVFMSKVDNVGITLRGTGGLEHRAGELGGQEIRSKTEVNLLLRDPSPICVTITMYSLDHSQWK